MTIVDINYVRIGKCKVLSSTALQPLSINHHQIFLCLNVHVIVCEARCICF